jgi:hypothetical protein
LVDDPEVASRCRSAKNTEAVRSVCAASATNNWRLEELFNLVRGDAVAGQVVDVVIIPLEFYIVHV